MANPKNGTRTFLEGAFALCRPLSPSPLPSQQSGQSRCLASTHVLPQIPLSHDLQPDCAGGATSGLSERERERRGGRSGKKKKVQQQLPFFSEDAKAAQLLEQKDGGEEEK